MSETSVWSGPSTEAGDVEWMLGYAILAPSSHNTQPWIVERRGDRAFDLYVDADRLLPQVDPFGRQTYISLGCLLEAAVLAARIRGRAVSCDPFPDGSEPDRALDDAPVVRVRAEENGRPTTRHERRLFEAITDRRTNKRDFETGRSIPGADAKALRSVLDDTGLAHRYVDEPDGCERLVDICTDAMATEVASEARNRELAEWFRFTKRELERRRDGFGLEQSGTTGIMRWIVETFVLDPEDAVDPEGTFARQGVEMCRKQAKTASAFVGLVTDENRRIDQLRTGRAYMRLQLMATALGVATHPLSQATEEYEDMRPVRRQLHEALEASPDQTVQMLVRAGYAEPTPHAPRRPIDAIVRSPARDPARQQYAERPLER